MKSTDTISLELSESNSFTCQIHWYNSKYNRRRPQCNVYAYIYIYICMCICMCPDLCPSDTLALHLPLMIVRWMRGRGNAMQSGNGTGLDAWPERVDGKILTHLFTLIKLPASGIEVGCRGAVMQWCSGGAVQLRRIHWWLLECAFFLMKIHLLVVFVLLVLPNASALPAPPRPSTHRQWRQLRRVAAAAAPPPTPPPPPTMRVSNLIEFEVYQERWWICHNFHWGRILIKLIY